MSYTQCPKCGGFNGMVGMIIYQCDCPPLMMILENELREAIAANTDVIDGVPNINSAGVVADLLKKGWKR